MEQGPGSHTQGRIYHNIEKYKTYIALFMQLQHRGDYAPIAAYEKSNGDISGLIYVNGNNLYTLSAEEVINRMIAGFETDNKPSVVLYHSDLNQKIAICDDELKAISVWYNFPSEGLSGTISFPYNFETDDTISYYGFENFTHAENNTIFSAKPEDNKDYFQDRIDTKPLTIENETGLQISKSNIATVSDMWCGVFGFIGYRTKNGSQLLQAYMAASFSDVPRFNENGIQTFHIDFDDIIFKSISVNNITQTIIPIVKTNYVIDVENNTIAEWENVKNMNAVISGKGKDTFGIKYFATDYAENREKYLTSKKQRVKLSGIAYVLDIPNNKSNADSELQFSEDFTGYMPNQDMTGYGCFDFIGLVEQCRKTDAANGKIKGYIIKVKLITNPDEIDFFTIDMFINSENMRMEKLEKGMKITGMFQLQGQIVTF